MPLNPVSFASRVNERFLRYQTSAHPLALPELDRQAAEMILGRDGEPSPLTKGPYLSLSRAFQEGARVAELVAAGRLHPAMCGVLPYPALFAHQAEALAAVEQGMHCLVSTGTGSGKTEAFLAPIVDHCLRLRDQSAPEGLTAVLVYPMNALAQDQRLRLRRMLAGTRISFGMYVGATPSRRADAPFPFETLQEGDGRDVLEKKLARLAPDDPTQVIPWEERLTEEEMRRSPPRILLTNYRQLEILLTRGADLGIFAGAPLRFLVFDEAHTYSGALGAEVACLIRRLRTFCGKTADEVTCIGTSATLADPEDGLEDARAFAHRFFGVPAERVALIGERYADYDWGAAERCALPDWTRGREFLAATLAALEGEGDGAAVGSVVRGLLGLELANGANWRELLFAALRTSFAVQALAAILERPRPLAETMTELGAALGQEVGDTPDTRAALLAVLALGAAARRSDQPLLRPKVHHFVQGLQGSVAAFADDSDDLQLFLTREDALRHFGERRLPGAVWPLLSCRTCGQHFLEGWLAGDPDGDGSAPGLAEEGNIVYEPVEPELGARILFTNRFFLEETEEEAVAEVVTGRLDRHREERWVCRSCGAFHGRPAARCARPGCGSGSALVPVHLLCRLGNDQRLSSCPSCSTRKSGRGNLEPVRPFKASQAADVHILGQEMLQAATDDAQRRLLIFTDNRQDAAFQAGWMADRARRYRFRHLMLQILRSEQAPLSVGEITLRLLARFAADPILAQALCPEVNDRFTEEAFGQQFEEELRKYVRSQVLLEWTVGLSIRQGLEVWGLARVVYSGIAVEDPWLRKWAARLTCSPECLRDGIFAWLDTLRRGDRMLWDPELPLFSHHWHPSAAEIQAGYFPLWSQPPKGVLLRFTGDDARRSGSARALLASRGRTALMGMAARWGVPAAEIAGFVEELWDQAIRGWRILVPVTLTRGQGRTPIAGTAGVHQIDGRQTGLEAVQRRWRCGVCQRIHSRATPRNSCTRSNCRGTLVAGPPPDGDYDVATLEQDFVLLRPEEHSAQVPAEKRRRIEEEFRKTDGTVNCLVATPTLEMGVDIGGLDMVLLRNVPPTPANYWQRVGRAGRQERMAVLYAYARAAPHDRYFFEDPMRLLAGRVETPRFNLRNPVLVRKHVHATVLSELIRAGREDDPWRLGEDERGLLHARLAEFFPTFANGYLLDAEGRYRLAPADVGGLGEILGRNRTSLLAALERTFQATWPEEASAQVTTTVLQDCLAEMARELQAVVTRLFERFDWARRRMAEIGERKARGPLQKDEESLLVRCDGFLKRQLANRRESYTLTVLAVEGFLPGYSLLEGSVTGFAGRHLHSGKWIEEFELPRAASLAVREYVPGNRLYANGGQFTVEYYRFPVGEEMQRPAACVVDLDPERLSVRELGQRETGYAQDREAALQVLPIADVQLGYASRIHDEEEHRYRLPVTVLGYLRERHRGGTRYRLGEVTLQHLRGQEVKLVNVGPSDLVKVGEVGYWVCPVCGATRSPYTDPDRLEDFRDLHRKRCGQQLRPIGFGADVAVDGFLFLAPRFTEATEPVSFAEAIRHGASRVLEMEEEDLQVLSMARGEIVEVFLYDPMPGGSGLLDQIVAKWSEVREAALELCRHCPGVCERSCYECLRMYRNSHFHRILDRQAAADLLEQGSMLVTEGPIPPSHREGETRPRTGSTNPYEFRLSDILSGAGLPEPVPQHAIVLEEPLAWEGGRIRSTTPDHVYLHSRHGADIAIYLDGPHHLTPQRRVLDALLREELRDMGWTVIEIPIEDLRDPTAMERLQRRLARRLGGTASAPNGPATPT